MLLTKTIIFVTASAYILMAMGVVAMSETLLTAIGALVVAVITAIGAVIVNVIVAKRVDKVGEKVDVVGERVEKNIVETEVVKGHVNSAATKAAAEIESLRKELQLMREVAADKKEEAALLAQAAASKPTNVPPAPPVAEETLVKIQENTADTVQAVKDIAIDTKPK